MKSILKKKKKFCFCFFLKVVVRRIFGKREEDPFPSPPQSPEEVIELTESIDMNKLFQIDQRIYPFNQKFNPNPLLPTLSS